MALPWRRNILDLFRVVVEDGRLGPRLIVEYGAIKRNKSPLPGKTLPLSNPLKKVVDLASWHDLFARSQPIELPSKNNCNFKALKIRQFCAWQEICSFDTDIGSLSN
jgi:hypothetical protein